MAVSYGFFDSVNGDRKYNAEQMTEFYNGICTQGVFQNLESGMAVSAGTGLTVSVAAGRAIVQNHWVKNNAALILEVPAASATYARIDAVVIRFSSSNRNITIAIKEGTAAASPSAPSMTRAGGVYELCLAYVNVAANATSVTVTDKRSNSSVCGWAAVAQATSGEVNQMLNDMKTGFDGVVYPSPAAMVQGCDTLLDEKIDRTNNGIITKLKKYNGIITSEGLTNVEVKAIERLEYIRVIGDYDFPNNPKLCVIMNTNDYPHAVHIIDSNNQRYVLKYDESTGCNFIYKDYARIIIKVNWDLVNSSFNVTYANSHILLDFSRSDVYNATYDNSAIIKKENPIVNSDLKVHNRVRKSIYSTMPNVLSTINTDGYVRVNSGSQVYGYNIYEVASGHHYRILFNECESYKPCLVALFHPTLFQNGDKIDVCDENIIYKTKSPTPAFVTITDVCEFVAPDDGYLYVYTQSTMGSQSDTLIVNEYSGDKGFLNDYVLDNVPSGSTEEKTAYPSLNVVCSGSSITWGTGYLDDSMVKYLDDTIRKELCTYIPYSDMVYSNGSVKTNQLFKDGGAVLLTGLNKTIEFDITGDELAICHAKRRSNDFGVIKVTADGTEIGRFDNYNPIQHTSESFTGDDLREIVLAHPATFNHQIYINGSSTALTNVVINKAGYGGTMPAGANALVFRKPIGTGEENCHAIAFANSLPTITSVTVTYDYGRMIAFERSSRGQTNTEYENESAYGAGSVSYDPAHPTTGYSSGLEFRGVDERAFFVHRFGTSAKRHIKLETVGGTNPYMLINFAANRFQNIMNAGIGGWTIDLVSSAASGINKYGQFYKWFRPEIIFQESETNDDWSYGGRRISRNIGKVTLAELQKMHWLEVSTVTYDSNADKYEVTVPTGIISSITLNTLVSSDIIGTQTAVGDIVRIGNYHGDIRQIVCRRISSVNLSTGEIGWIEPLNVDEMLNVDTLSDLVGAEINIRNLDGYKTTYSNFVDKVHAISPQTIVCVVNNGLPNLWTRQLWGYDLIHEDVCKDKAFTKYVDARDYLYKAEFADISGSKSETVTSTGASEYDLNFVGNNAYAWAGFKVLVNGVDVYGKDAYIEINQSYYIKDTLTGSDCNKTLLYDRSKATDRAIGKMKLVFTKNVPASGGSIVVQYADSLWSNDFTHPNDFGAKVYAKAYADVIKKGL